MTHQPARTPEGVDRVSADRFPTELLAAKLELRDRLVTEERLALMSLPIEVTTFARGDELVHPYSLPAHSRLLASGFAARFNVFRSGARSLTHLGAPGDFLDLHSLLMRQMDHGVVALSECVVATVAHRDLRPVLDRWPHLTRLLWLETVVDGAMHRQHIHLLARQSALGRMAHFFCEMLLRLEAVDRVSADSYALPISQTDLGDLLGMSGVHVNRVLMELRRNRLVEWADGRVVIPDRNRLTDLAEFDPTYLRLFRAEV